MSTRHTEYAQMIKRIEQSTRNHLNEVLMLEGFIEMHWIWHLCVMYYEKRIKVSKCLSYTGSWEENEEGNFETRNIKFRPLATHIKKGRIQWRQRTKRNHIMGFMFYMCLIKKWCRCTKVKRLKKKCRFNFYFIVQLSLNLDRFILDWNTIGIWNA